MHQPLATTCSLALLGILQPCWAGLSGDGDSAELMSDAQLHRIGFIFVVTIILFFVRIKWMLVFWGIVAGMSAAGLIFDLEDLGIAVVVFLSLIWMGVKEVLGGEGE